MEANQILNYKYSSGTKEVYPANEMVKSWKFTEGTEDEAALAHFVAIVAEKNGINANSLQHIFPCVLRLLKSQIDWSK